MSRTSLALIGCGGMGQSHLSRFFSLADRLEVKNVVDVDIEVANRVAALVPGAEPASDYRSVLSQVDAVLIALPHHLHHSVALECLRCNKHVLLEKPMANTEKQCEELIETALGKQRVLMIAYCMRYHPLVLALKHAVDQKLAGDLFQLSIWTEQHTQAPPESWMCREETLGGGQLFSHGCHYVDLLLWFLGWPKRGIHMGTNRGTPWMEREGTSNVCLEFEDGRLGYHFGTWGARGSKLGYSFHAHCDGGLLEADFSGKKLILHKGKHQEVITEPSESSKHTEYEMAHFLDCIEKDQTPLTDGTIALQSLRVIWELYKAEDNRDWAQF